MKDRKILKKYIYIFFHPLTLIEVGILRKALDILSTGNSMLFGRKLQYPASKNPTWLQKA